MTTLAQLIQTAESLWPLSAAEDWDAPGLVTGTPAASITKVLLTVDVTASTVEAAVASGAQVLLAHHPFLMRGVKTVSEETSKGSTVARAIRSNLAIYAAHTNADVVQDGVSDVLARLLGVVSSQPLQPTGDGIGVGRIGDLETPTTLGEFAQRIARVLPATATGVRVAGEFNQPVQTVGVCGGAGDSLVDLAAAAGADVYVTADLRHHVVQDAREAAALNTGARGNGTPAIIDVSHWASEWLWLDIAAQQLRKIHPGISFEVCDLRTDPWDFVVTQ